MWQARELHVARSCVVHAGLHPSGPTASNILGVTFSSKVLQMVRQVLKREILGI
mgnify:CR=1 FL=1